MPCLCMMATCSARYIAVENLLEHLGISNQVLAFARQAAQKAACFGSASGISAHQVQGDIGID